MKGKGNRPGDFCKFARGRAWGLILAMFLFVSNLYSAPPLAPEDPPALRGGFLGSRSVCDVFGGGDCKIGAPPLLCKDQLDLA